MPAMTIDEFIERLRSTPRAWYLYGAKLRLSEGNGHHCPLSAVAASEDGRPFHNCGTASYDGLKLGLATDDVSRIMNAADDCAVMCQSDAEKYRDPELRARLIQACGLKK